MELLSHDCAINFREAFVPHHNLITFVSRCEGEITQIEIMIVNGENPIHTLFALDDSTENVFHDIAQVHFVCGKVFHYIRNVFGQSFLDGLFLSSLLS